ncbi:MAG: hypothetical protein AB7H71_05205 [Alphaproteobacteria bacterium]
MALVDAVRFGKAAQFVARAVLAEPLDWRLNALVPVPLPLPMSNSNSPVSAASMMRARCATRISG